MGVPLNRLMGCFRNSFVAALLGSSAMLYCVVFFMPHAWAQNSKVSILNSGKNKNVAQRKVDLQAEAKLLQGV